MYKDIFLQAEEASEILSREAEEPSKVFMQQAEEASQAMLKAGIPDLPVYADYLECKQACRKIQEGCFNG